METDEIIERLKAKCEGRMKEMQDIMDSSNQVLQAKGIARQCFITVKKLHASLQLLDDEFVKNIFQEGLSFKQKEKTKSSFSSPQVHVDPEWLRRTKRN